MIKGKTALSVYEKFVEEHNGVEPTLEQFLKIGYVRSTFYLARKQYRAIKEKELKRNGDEN